MFITLYYEIVHQIYESPFSTIHACSDIIHACVCRMLGHADTGCKSFIAIPALAPREYIL